jgi:hypothetical protein
MTPWTTDELERIERARELGLASLGPDGTLRKPITIWVDETGSPVTWGQHLTDEQYNSAPARSL